MFHFPLTRFFISLVTRYSRLHANQTDGQTNIVKFSVDLTSEFAVHDRHWIYPARYVYRLASRLTTEMLLGKDFSCCLSSIPHRLQQGLTFNLQRTPFCVLLWVGGCLFGWPTLATCLGNNSQNFYLTFAEEHLKFPQRRITRRLSVNSVDRD